MGESLWDASDRGSATSVLLCLSELGLRRLVLTKLGRNRIPASLRSRSRILTFGADRRKKKEEKKFFPQWVDAGYSIRLALLFV